MASRVARFLTAAALLASLAIGVDALFQPWARGTVLAFSITRSPGAALLAGMTLLLVLASGAVVASWRGQRVLAAGVHLGGGVLMCAVSWVAFSMVEKASVVVFGFLPVIPVRPGPGLWRFLLAALVLSALGLLQLTVHALQRSRSSRRTA